MKLTSFRVTKYRNIIDSGQIDVNDITAFVGQNEAGKSNLFEALYRINPFQADATYNFKEDWPVDLWGEQDKEAKVCEADFLLDQEEIDSLLKVVLPAAEEGKTLPRPNNLTLILKRHYGGSLTYSFRERNGASEISTFVGEADQKELGKWIKQAIPKFVYIHDYELSGSQIELPALAQRKSQVQWNDLSNEEQTILTILDLAKVDLNDIIKKGESPEGRTVRAFDTRHASAYLSSQFKSLWRQKEVRFEIAIDATTLNIFAEDAGIGMPVRLNRRSTGFRWHVAFAWKFTHASKGHYRNCILLLEEPGIHLHYSAQLDLLDVFERLRAQENTILYTTHLASMVDQAYPERIRMVETSGTHAVVKKGVVSSQKGPMAVIEMRLGLTGTLSGLLGNRKTLIVEGGDDALILTKLSGVLQTSGKDSLSDSIYFWPADGASKTPMYAAVAIGHKWDAGVLLDSDQEGKDAKKKIDDLYLRELAEADAKKFRVLMIGDAAGIKKTDAAIEELFPDEYYIDLVNRAYAIAVKTEDLPQDGSDMITKRVEVVLKQKFGFSGLDKRRVMAELLRRFDTWAELKHLPDGTAAKAEKLFKKINEAFGASKNLKAL